MSFAWPCNLVLESHKVTGGCEQMGVTFGPDGATLLVDGVGDGGACSVTLVFTNGVEYSRSLQASPETLADGCVQYSLQPSGPFQVAPPCGADASTSD